MEIFDQQRDNQLDIELSKFNWGAFGCDFIWAIFNGAWSNYWPILIIQIILFFFAQVPIIGIFSYILLFALAIYIGKKGNEWAYYGSKKWKNLDEFIKVQRIWGLSWPVVRIVVYTVIYTVVFSVSTMHFSSILSKMEQKSEFLTKLAISSAVQSPSYKETSTGLDLADSLIALKKYKRVLIYSDGVIVDQSGPFMAIVTFNKDGKCSLESKNCYAEYNLRKKRDLTEPAVITEKYYFDDLGIVEKSK